MDKISAFLQGFPGTSQSGGPFEGRHYVIRCSGARLGLRHPAIFSDRVHSGGRVRSSCSGRMGVMRFVLELKRPFQLTIPPWPMYRRKPLHWQKPRNGDSGEPSKKGKKKN